MDPDISGILGMFAPKPGQDPFATGAQLATNPDAMAGQLATLGPPPPPGQGFADWFTNKISGPGNAPGTTPPMPQPTVPPRAPGQTFGGPGGPQEPSVTGPFSSNPTAPSPLIAPGGYGNAANPRMGGPFPPSPPSPDIPGAPPSMGPQFNEAFGSVPPSPGYTGVDNVPGVGPVPTTGALPGMPRDLDSGPTPPGAISTPPLENTRRTVPDILAPLAKPAESAKPPMTPEQVKKTQEALKGLGGLLQGVKAPPAPETQKISSPSLPRTGTIQTGGLEALLQAMQGRAGAGAGTTPLRLGNALYAGGRGLY